MDFIVPYNLKKLVSELVTLDKRHGFPTDLLPEGVAHTRFLLVQFQKVQHAPLTFEAHEVNIFLVDYEVVFRDKIVESELG